MQIYHGSVDQTLNVQNYYETIKQWTGVFGYPANAVSTVANYPRSPYTKYVFGDKFQVSAVLFSYRSLGVEGLGLLTLRDAAGRLSWALASLTPLTCSPRKISSGSVSP